MTGLIEPINSRITDPRYYLDSPHQGTTPGRSNHPQQPRPVANNSAPLLCDLSFVAAAILEKVGKPNIKLQMVGNGHLTIHTHLVVQQN